MKKKLLMCILVILVVLILWHLPIVRFSTGRCIVTENGTYLILIDNAPVTMSNCSGREELWEGLNTGDLVRIIHDEIQETYPGRTGVYHCKRLSEGTPEDIPQEVLEQLRALGWTTSDTSHHLDTCQGQVLSFEPVRQDPGNYLLKLWTESGDEATITVVGDTTIHAIDGIDPGDTLRVRSLAETGGYTQAQEITEYRQVSCAHGYANMRMELPAGWDYEICEYDENNYAFGIRFWPADQDEGALWLEYYPRGFGVCGTGLVQEEIQLENGLSAWVGTYDGRAIWDFITIRGLPGPFSYVIRTEKVDSWWESRQQEAMEIIRHITLAENVIWEDAAVQIAKQALNTTAEPSRTDFAFQQGTWIIQFDQNTRAVTIDADGTILDIT